MYISPSQSTSEFESFVFGLQDFFSNIICSKFQTTIILGELNAEYKA